MQYSHGGDVWGREVRLDFSANLNPLGMPESVRRAAASAAAQSDRYPDPLCRDLRSGIARRDGVAPEQVLCGSGAADLIFRLGPALRPRRVLVTAPTFSEYRQSMELSGCRVEEYVLRADKGFDLTEDYLNRLEDGLDAVFLCTPNNPTGRPISQGMMEQILRRCAAKHIRVVADECFLELSDGAGPGLAQRLMEFPNLLLLRAFTKSYAMAGLRLGYCLSADGALLERIARCAQPWSVSAPAQAAGLAALKELAWPEQARALIRAERTWMAAELERLPVKVFHSTANYLLFQAAGVADLKDRLLERGILIRSCANYSGLGPDYYRVAVRPHAENEALIAALKEVL